MKYILHTKVMRRQSKEIAISFSIITFFRNFIPYKNKKHPAQKDVFYQLNFERRNDLSAKGVADHL
ncbi:hypothetical protein COM71_24390 [Priestia megaterium]|nr:hypothetical protein COM71_24390 [Priestia megaterium]